MFQRFNRHPQGGAPKPFIMLAGPMCHMAGLMGPVSIIKDWCTPLLMTVKTSKHVGVM
jgi:hypothetical protein